MITWRSLAFVCALGGPAVALTLAGAGCSSFTADAETAGGADAGAEGGTAAESGVPVDGSTPDVVVIGDAYCAAHALDPGFYYCNDFETPASASDPFGFSKSAISPTVTSIAVVADNPRHAVMKVAVDAKVPGSHEVSVQQTISAPGLQPFQADLDIKILSNDAASVTLAALKFASGTCEAEYGLGAFDGSKVGGTRNRDVPLQPYTADQWQHVTIAIIKDGASATGFRELVTYGGLTIVDREARSSSGGDPRECAILGLIVGVTESGPAVAHVTVAYDNVLIRKL